MIIPDRPYKLSVGIMGVFSIVVVATFCLFLGFFTGRGHEFEVGFDRKKVLKKRILEDRIRLSQRMKKTDCLGQKSLVPKGDSNLNHFRGNDFSISGPKKPDIRIKKLTKMGSVGAGFLVNKLLAIESHPRINGKEEDRLISALKRIGPPALPSLGNIVCGGDRIPFGVKTLSFSIILGILAEPGPEGLEDAMRVFEGAFACKDNSVKVNAILAAQNIFWRDVLKKFPWLEGPFKKIILENIFACLFNENEKVATAASNFIIMWLSRESMVKYWKRIKKALVCALPYVRNDCGKRIKYLIREMGMRRNQAR